MPISYLLHAFTRSATHEARFLHNNRWDFANLFWLPLGLIFLVWWIFSKAYITDVPIGIIDQSHSPQSATLIRYLDATPDLAVIQMLQSPAQAEQAIQTAQIYAVVEIPSDFATNLLAARPAPVVLDVNAQFGTHSGIVQKGVQAAIATFAAGAEMQKNVKKGQAITQAKNTFSPIQVQRIGLFNPTNNYQQFLASTVIPSLLHILAMVIGATTIGRELRDKTLKEWYLSVSQPRAKNQHLNQRILENANLKNGDLETSHLDNGMLKTPFLENEHFEKSTLKNQNTPIIRPDFWTLVFALNGKLIFPMLCYALWGAVCFSLMAQVMPTRLDSLAVTYACFLALMMVSFWLGAIFTMGTYSLRQGLSFTGFFSAPSYAFAGVTFPYIAISSSAKHWADMLPLTHYLKVQITQLQMGAPLTMAIPTLYGFVLAVLGLMLVATKITQRTFAHPEKWGKR